MRKILIIVAISIQPHLLFAQTSFSVPADNRVYRAIDRLVAAGVVDNIVVGQRPYTAGEIARIILEAEANFDRLKRPTDKMMVWRMLGYWKKMYAEEIGRSRLRAATSDWHIHFLKRLDIDYQYLHGPDRAVFDNGLGTAGAHVRPITADRGGRHYAPGNNYSFESHHSLTGPYFALFAHPRFQLQIRGDDDDGEDKVFVQELYGKFGLQNFELEVGRDELIWGQGEFGGLIFSDNARPLDFVKISNPHPFRLPWIFEHIGNVKGTIFLANMGPSYHYKYSYLSAWKLSIQPAAFAEVGFYYGFIIGGDGAPKISTGDVARTFFGFIPRVSKASVSYDVGGFDLRFRIPPLWDTELYAEVYFNDPDLAHPGVMFADRAAYLGGIYLPRLGGSHNMALRFEYRHTSPYIYRDSKWADGFALSGEFLGDSLGPDAGGVYANYYYDLGEASRFIARFAYEARGGDVYRIRASDGGFDKVTSRPTERRYRGIVALEHPIKKILRLKWLFGFEAISDFNFIAGDDRSSVIGGLNLSFQLDI